MKTKTRLRLIEETFEYTFRDKQLALQALTHSSYRKFAFKNRDNENLEFLGDSVINSCITDILFREYPHQKEGNLTKLRASIVNNKSLADTVTNLGINRTLKLGPGQKLSESMLSDLFEAIMGAIFLDGGYHNLFFVLKKVYKENWQKIAVDNTDFKSQLQELSQVKYKTKPEYQMVEVSGPSHERVFKMAVLLNGKVEGVGEGNSKKQGEQNAAKEALEKLNLK